MSNLPKEVATPIRFPAVALLCVDSEDGYRFDNDGYRVDTNQPNRIYINRQRPLTFGYMTRVALTEVNMQWDTPNINDRNNSFEISIINTSGGPVASTEVTIQIDNGFYKPSELANAIEDALNTEADIITYLNVTGAGKPFTVSVDPTTLRMTIAQTTPIADFDSFAFSLLPPAKGTQNLLNVIGLLPFGQPQDYESVTGSYATYQYTPYIDIVSNYLTKNQNVSDGDTALNNTGQKLARIYLSNEAIEARTDDNIIGTRPFVFRREFKTPKYITWNTTENIDVIDIQVLDYLGNPLFISPNEEVVGNDISYNNSAAIQFTLQVSEN